MSRNPNKLIPEAFTPVPSQIAPPTVRVVAALADPEVVGVVVSGDRPVPAELGLTTEALRRAGFDGGVGSVLAVPQEAAPLRVAVGGGASAELDVAALRSIAAAFAQATRRAGRIGLHVPSLGPVAPDDAAEALTEGAVLARYRYTPLRAAPPDTPLESIELVLGDADADMAAAGVRTGLVASRAAQIARDLSNAPPAHLTAEDLSAVARELGSAHGFSVEVFGRQELIEMECGGILGVNRGSAEEPQLIRLGYEPPGGGGPHLVLVGKGIMYDSGGISLKPSDPMHLLMKMDMGGVAAILGAFASLRDVGVACRVTAYLACTDNMPGSGAYVLGDVLHSRGRTVEIRNTDAEGRVAMCDALSLAAETAPDAIVTIATLTGAALTSLGPAIAPILGSNQRMVDQVTAAAAVTGEPVWQLPLEASYRKQLDSDIADIANLGGPHAGTITAALFIADFVDPVPWAHVDIAGTMQVAADEGWRPKGATGFGARLLLELARSFAPPAPATSRGTVR